jgi:hypothetical protein
MVVNDQVRHDGGAPGDVSIIGLGETGACSVGPSSIPPLHEATNQRLRWAFAAMKAGAANDVKLAKDRSA